MDQNLLQFGIYIVYEFHIATELREINFTDKFRHKTTIESLLKGRKFY